MATHSDRSPDLDSLEAVVDKAFAPGEHPLAVTQILLVTQHGKPVVERYADGFDEDTPMISWSMAKSVLSAAVGILVADGRLSMDERAAVPEWSEPDDPRHAITLRHLMQMRSGLQWNEDYVDGETSDVIEMLFRDSRRDTAGYAAKQPLEHSPGEQFLYSSGTSNIISRIVRDVCGGETGYRTFLQDRLFEPIGMTVDGMKFDPAGTWIGSSFLYAAARDFARFGQLFLDNGAVGGQQVLPTAWVTESVQTHAIEPETGQGYGLQWWTIPDDRGMFAASGYEGQRIQVAPKTGVVIVRLGKTDTEFTPQLQAFYDDVARCFEV